MTVRRPPSWIGPRSAGAWELGQANAVHSNVLAISESILVRYRTKLNLDILTPGGLEGMGTRKTSVEIDEELLDAARKILETTTVKDTVEEAFREVARVEARRREVEALTRMEDLDLADPEIMAEAWRS